MKIIKLQNNHVIDFAAEELKKYLRMMMPEKGEISISADPREEGGFRLGLLEDFGLPFEGEDRYFDDVVHIDAGEAGGILAGSNPRSVLFAVYRFLKLNGCRFYFPGPSGEKIPMQPVKATAYHKLADYRLRGHTIEGAPSLEQVLSYIDFHAKSELNAFGLYGIDVYQRRWYVHDFNEKNRREESYDGHMAETQWRALYESECKKRGMVLYAGEHGLIPDALKLDVTARELYRSGEKELPEEIRPLLAMTKGKRQLHHRDILSTQLCYSNPRVRTLLAKEAARQAMETPHLDYMGVTVADGKKNHCECEACRQKRPSDWYVMLLNEIDEELTTQGVQKKILFSYYTDMKFAPTQEKIKNPSRFMLQYCPTARAYTSSITEDSVIPEPMPYTYNGWEDTKNAEEDYALFLEWKKAFPGPYSVFEYHFWWPQYRDPGSIFLARSVHEDVRSYKTIGTCGCMEDGSNKSFFPNGFAGHIYAETLVNRDVDYEKEMEEYYVNLYGEDWKAVCAYLKGITDAFDFAYMQGFRSEDPRKGKLYAPSRASHLAQVPELAAAIRDLEKKHRYDGSRHQWVAWQLLVRHGDYCEGLAEVMTEKCLGHDRLAMEKFYLFLEKCGKWDRETENYFDFGLMARSILTQLRKGPMQEI